MFTNLIRIGCEKVHCSVLIFIVFLFFFQTELFANQVTVIPIVGPTKTVLKNSIPVSDVIELAGEISIGESEDLRRNNPSSPSLGAFTIPDGKYLIVNSINIFPHFEFSQSPHPSQKIVAQMAQSDRVRYNWYLSSEPLLLSYSPGIVFLPGETITIINQEYSDVNFLIQINGYLTDQ